MHHRGGRPFPSISLSFLFPRPSHFTPFVKLLATLSVLAEAAFLGAHRAQLMLRVRCANDLFPFPFSTPFHCESCPSRSLGPHRPRSAIYRLVLRVPFRYRPRLPSSFTACPSLMQRAQLVLRVRHIEQSFSPFVSSLRLPVVGDPPFQPTSFHPRIDHPLLALTNRPPPSTSLGFVVSFDDRVDAFNNSTP